MINVGGRKRSLVLSYFGGAINQTQAAKCFPSVLLPSPKRGPLDRLIETGLPETMVALSDDKDPDLGGEKSPEGDRVGQRLEEEWAGLVRGIEMPVKSKFWDGEET